MEIARKTPESDPDSSIRIQIPKPVSFSNGVLKLSHHSGDGDGGNGGGRGGEIGGVVYKECLKNHAASLGAHAMDGCGEFMPSPAANSADPTSLKCAACGCHRNFHRQETEESLRSTNTAAALEYQPHHRHHPPPPHPPSGEVGANSSPSSASPPPISSSYYPSAPHLFLTLSGGATPVGNRTDPMVNGRKRFRTRFTQNQKAKMLEFAEKLNWKMQRKDEEIINGFCNEIEVEKGVFKVWMHNNKNILGKREHSNAVPTIIIPATQIQTPNSNSNPGTTNNGNGISFLHNNHQNHGIIQNHEINANNNNINHFNGDSVNCPNGSSSSS